ncbi:MAG TPA: helix-turn-helix domain-containing protein [Dehalococcoidia bacterium]|jgi:cytoskeleton protein RodZ|nr:helix-turn-helix domain-containing protein [Dehalococcoidia bacterium]
MPELGKTLSQARVARGLTLEDCERDTRISKRYLDALEREDWKIFPAPVYSRAFLRTYAQYLGLNPNDLMRMFHAQAEQEAPEFKPLPEIRQAPATGNVNWLLAGAVLAFLAVAGIFLYMSSRGGSDAKLNAAKATPTAQTEALGGGQPPAGRPVGNVTKGTVPDLTDVRVDDAIAALDGAGISYVVVETDSVSGTPDVVVSQDPAPGTKAGGGTSVTLVVPRG